MIEYCLTTVDNPFNPHDNFDRWYREDLRLARVNDRIDCCSYLARIAITSPFLTDEQNIIATNEAIDWIIKNDPTRTGNDLDTKVYCRVGKEYKPKVTRSDLGDFGNLDEPVDTEVF